MGWGSSACSTNASMSSMSRNLSSNAARDSAVRLALLAAAARSNLPTAPHLTAMPTAFRMSVTACPTVTTMASLMNAKSSLEPQTTIPPMVFPIIARGCPRAPAVWLERASRPPQKIAYLLPVTASPRISHVRMRTAPHHAPGIRTVMAPSTLRISCK